VVEDHPNPSNSSDFYFAEVAEEIKVRHGRFWWQTDAHDGGSHACCWQSVTLPLFAALGATCLHCEQWREGNLDCL
jgi:hypothetical protein